MTTMQIQVGDIVLVELDPTRGDEKSKTRPCLVIENGSGTPLGLMIVLPITTDASSKKSGIFVSIPDIKKSGLKKPSAIDCYQIRTLSLRRIKKRLGVVQEEILDIVRTRLALILDIGAEHLDG